MRQRTITIGDTLWRVAPSGFITTNTLDEFGLVFTRDVDGAREIRVTRYSPVAARSRERSFAELTDDDLRGYFQQSQPSFTSPEAGYLRG